MRISFIRIFRSITRLALTLITNSKSLRMPRAPMRCSSSFIQYSHDAFRSNRIREREKEPSAYIYNASTRHHLLVFIDQPLVLRVDSNLAAFESRVRPSCFIFFVSPKFRAGSNNIDSFELRISKRRALFDRLIFFLFIGNTRRDDR